MKTSTLIALGGLGFAAWWLTRRGSGVVAPTASTGSGFGAHTSVSDSSIVGDAYDPGDIDWFLQFGQRGDLCSLPDDRHTPWSDAQKACVAKYHANRANAFVRQVVGPASRVPITSLTKDDFTLAAAFLAQKLTRKGCPWTYGQSKAVNDFNDEVGWAQDVVKIALPIVNALSFGLVGKVGGAISGTNPDDATHVTDDYEAAIAAAPQYTHNGENDLTIKDAPTPGIDYDATDPEFTINGGSVVLFDPSYQSEDSVFINAFGPSLDFGFDPIVMSDGTKQFFRCMLFRSANESTTWEKPWVARELGYPFDDGDGGSITDKTLTDKIVVAHARLYRTLDVWGATLKPYFRNVLSGTVPTPDADGNISASELAGTLLKTSVPGTQSYKVGAVELWGCCLPAHPLDRATTLDEAANAARKSIEQSYLNPPTTTSKATIDAEASTLVKPTATISPVATQSTLVSPTAGATAITSTTPTTSIGPSATFARTLVSRRR